MTVLKNYSITKKLQKALTSYFVRKVIDASIATVARQNLK